MVGFRDGLHSRLHEDGWRTVREAGAGVGVNSCVFAKTDALTYSRLEMACFRDELHSRLHEDSWSLAWHRDGYSWGGWHWHWR